ncbi:MAG: adenosylmethionine decarboxylase, partial [Deltaproteobacteria bacterium]
MPRRIRILTPPLDTRSRHVLAEYHGCDPAVLDDRGTIEPLMRRAAQAAGATVVGSMFHEFAPQGVSGVVVVEESHLSIHTWPEYGYAAVDFFTCG